MGAFLIINGYDFKIEKETCTQQEVDQGSFYETQNGALFCPVARRVRTWSFTTTLLPLAELQAVKQWIFGQNVVWSFDQTMFSKYTGFADAVANAGVTFANTTPKFAGTYYGDIGTTTPIKWDVSAMNWKKFEPYTFAGWGYNASTTTWNHYAHLSYFGADLPTAASSYVAQDDSKQYTNGSLLGVVQRGAAPSVFAESGYPAVACASANYYDALDTPIKYSDYTLFKGCHLTPLMIAALSSMGQPRRYPFVEVSGDAVGGRSVADPITVIGRCDAEKFTWAGNQQMGSLSFSLIEANLDPV